MGGGIFKCCKDAVGFEVIDSDGEEDPYARDIIILRNMMNGAPSIFLAVTISYPDGKVRAVVPEGQSLDSTCIKDIVNFFKGKTGGLAERFVNLGPGLPREKTKLLVQILYKFALFFTGGCGYGNVSESLGGMANTALALPKIIVGASDGCDDIWYIQFDITKF
ncbi:hypothetical protein HELRODRAFT_178812 [Helobdella robusta]|uniref:Uncharacterized protein n=1 Tax=Helobdella robusta TaxID=6412 RepID=T1FDS1_HELRO|nr:hypothetical protein HELRODRAFT_178812 [Helobdella robusta]ESN95897.1 hypothetical protein HELRODRAFT_178812 [Helobdella robusta]